MKNTVKKHGHKWKKGSSGNPKGKPKGAKNKVTLVVKEILTAAIENEFENIGPTLAKIRTESSVDYLKCLTNLMEYVVPKLGRVEHTGDMVLNIPTITFHSTNSNPIKKESDLDG